MSKQSPIKDYSKEFKKVIEGFRYNRGIREIFTDWLEIAACAIHQEPYHLGLVPRDEAFDKMEAQYMAAVKKYSKEELDAFAKLLGITKMALWEGKEDFLGQMYMELEISQERSGEFFTPFPVSLMIAKMMLGDLTEQIREKGFITVADPACGGGGMLIATAQVIEEQGYNPAEVMFFEATDISKACCDMAYLQTSILGLSGIVRHGNTLSMEEKSYRFTPICRVHPARTNTFLQSLYSPQAEQSISAGEQSSSQPTQEEQQAQQSSIFSLLEEATELGEERTTVQAKGAKPAANATANLSTETDDLVQGRLF